MSGNKRLTEQKILTPGEKFKIKALADKYETKDFILLDPIQVVHDMAGRSGASREDIEITAIITSWICYGQRGHIIRRANMLMELMDYQPYKYLMSDEWKQYDMNFDSFYRFYRWEDFYTLMLRLKELYSSNAFLFAPGSWAAKNPLLHLVDSFQHIRGCPKDLRSVCKKLNLLLRWMVRRYSHVDLGIWKHISPKNLLLPVDTHVQRCAKYIGMFPRDCSVFGMGEVIYLTDYMRQVFPEDPARGDYALFGYGVEYGNFMDKGQAPRLINIV